MTATCSSAGREADTGLQTVEPSTATAPPPLVVVVPVRTVSGLNVREWWRVRQRRVKREREAVAEALVSFSPLALPLAIKLTRLGWNMLDDDAVPGALKAIRDEVAVWLGLPNDRSRPGLTWSYSQEIDRSPPRVVRDGRGHTRTERGSVRITITLGEVTP
jgi:hypothetical protein